MKKRLLAMLTLIMMLNNPNALSEDSRLPQGEYSNGIIYIGSSDYIEEITESVGPYDVLIVDERDFKKNPNIKIINSYKITDKEQMLEIIRFLNQYEIDHPTEWERSELSMYREWLIHNFFYYLDVKHSSTRDVDFDNKEEYYYVRKRK